MPLRFRILAAGAEVSSREPGPAADRLVEVPDHLDSIRFGRRAGLEVALPFPALSALHARLTRDRDAWIIEDLGSTNGIFVEGQRLTPGTGYRLQAGQVFKLAHVAILFEGSGPSDRAAEGTGTIARRLVSDLFAQGQRGEVSQVVVLDGPQAGLALRLTQPDRPYTVGRAATCDLVTAVDEVSREHAAFTRRWEGVFVRDLGSKNGIVVDGERVAGERRLRDGDCVQVGAISLRMDDPEDRYLQQMEAPDVLAPSAPPAEAPLDPPLAPEVEPRTLPPRGTRPRAATAVRAIAALVLFAVAALLLGLLLN